MLVMRLVARGLSFVHCKAQQTQPERAASKSPDSLRPIAHTFRPAELLDELCAEVACEAHREHTTGTLVHQPPGPPPPRPKPLDPLPGVKGPTDVFGQVRGCEQDEGKQLAHAHLQ
jgi:hypothetical protein